MEKYAKLMKGLEMCAGPECCKDGCPYYNTTTGGMTCRARLLLDANIAITNEQARAVEAEEQLQDVTEELDEERFTNSNLEGEKDKLQAEAEWARNELEKVVGGRRSVEAHLDAIESDRADITRERDKLRADNEELRKECDMTVIRCQVLQNEINSLMRKIGKQEDKTDRPSVSDEALKNEYKRGYLDAMEYCFRELCKRAGGGCRHE